MADERVEAAIRHWASRFIANGIDYNDFVRTTASVSHRDQWLDAWTTTAEGHVDSAERSLAQGNRRSAGEAYLHAAVSYHFSKFVWVLDPARNRGNAEAAVRSIYAAHELLDPSAERIEAELDGGAVVANLRRPTSRRAGGSPPLVVLIPGLDSTKEEFFHRESVFLNRGMATLSLDGPGQGAGADGEADARCRAHELNLDGVAERVRRPSLVVTGKLDRVIPWEETKRIADAVPDSEWVLYGDGTHVCNNIPFKYRPLVSDWIGARLDR